MWKLTKNKDSIYITVCCSLRTKTPNKDMDDSEVTGLVAVNSARRRRKKMSPSTLACSQVRMNRFLDQKSSGNPDLASPEGNGTTAVLCEQETVDSLSVEKELENTSLACGSKGFRYSAISPHFV